MKVAITILKTMMLLIAAMFVTQIVQAEELYPTKINMYFTNNTPHDIQITSRRWSSSYWPQFPTILKPGQRYRAGLKRYGYGASFSMNVKNLTTGQTCYFSADFSERYFATYSARTNRPLASCSDSNTYSSAWFSMGVGEWRPEVIDQDDDDIPDDKDNCPTVPNTDQADFDTDSIGDVCDLDIDGDNVNNDIDNCPVAPNPDQANFDGDELGDVCDDSDTDGLFDNIDNCPLIANSGQEDMDNDGVGDVCDDSDEDSVVDAIDNCPLIANPGQENLDGDAFGDVCDPDIDGDTVSNEVDNCPLITNQDQADLDEDGIGNVCDPDIDGDNVNNEFDNCQMNYNPGQEDLDGDFIGDVCDTDIDGDSIDNELDNCPIAPNTDQADLDGDLIGDVCDPDIDGDSVNNELDNCPIITNPNQEDFDSDGTGDVCDSDIDGDGFNNELDCNNYDPAINPGSTEILNNGIDENCSGLEDDTIEGATAALSNNIASLDPSLFVKNNGKGKGASNSSKQKQYQQQITTLIGLVNTGNITEGINKVDMLLFKTDGCLTNDQADNNDWLIDCDAQVIIYSELVKLKNILVISQ